jgi:hypothetical protein
MKAISKDEFIKTYCEKSKISEQKLLESCVILPCYCGSDGCKGWAVVSNDELSIKAHRELYQKR